MMKDIFLYWIIWIIWSFEYSSPIARVHFYENNFLNDPYENEIYVYATYTTFGH